MWGGGQCGPDDTENRRSKVLHAYYRRNFPTPGCVYDGRYILPGSNVVPGLKVTELGPQPKSGLNHFKIFNDEPVVPLLAFQPFSLNLPQLCRSGSPLSRHRSSPQTNPLDNLQHRHHRRDPLFQVAVGLYVHHATIPDLLKPLDGHEKPAVPTAMDRLHPHLAKRTNQVSSQCL